MRRRRWFFRNTNLHGWESQQQDTERDWDEEVASWKRVLADIRGLPELELVTHG